MNKVFLIGRLTDEPNKTETPNGIAVATLITVNRRFRRDGNSHDFARCTWRKTAELWTVFE